MYAHSDAALGVSPDLDRILGPVRLLRRRLREAEQERHAHPPPPLVDTMLAVTEQDDETVAAGIEALVVRTVMDILAGQGARLRVTHDRYQRAPPNECIAQDVSELSQVLTTASRAVATRASCTCRSWTALYCAVTAPPASSPMWPPRGMTSR